MATAGAQKQFIHGLIEQSRERVVQVRAGQSLVHVLDEYQQQSPLAASPLQHKSNQKQRRRQHSDTNSSDTLPALPTMTLVYEARRHADAAAKSSAESQQSHASAMRMNLRKRGVLANDSTATTTATITSSMKAGPIAIDSNGIGRHASTDTFDRISSQKFLEYMHSKSAQVETLHQNDRRKAITRSTRQMAQLAVKTQPQHPHGRPATKDAAKALFACTLAAVKGKNALLNLKKTHESSHYEPLQAQEPAKNAHFAFLDFKRDAESGDERHKQPHLTVGLDESNTKTRTPIRFGDQLCFISESSDLPLAIGADGRSCAVSTLSAGPHMAFTVADFRNPNRHCPVTEDDDFWLRVDPALIQRSSGSGDADGSELDVSHLLSETHYYLGCAGSIEDPDEPGNEQQSRSHGNKENLRGSARSYALPSTHMQQQKAHCHDTFRLIAIKATVPSAEYYGDDRATREYTVETNESVLRLAKWRFTRNSRAPVKLPSSRPRGDRRDEEEEEEVEVERMLLNCASVYLSLNHFVLECGDATTFRSRGVMRDYSGRGDVAQLVKKRGRAICSAASWQVRLLRQAPRPASPAKASLSSSPSSGSGGKQQQQLIVKELLESPAEWLKKKQETVAKNEAVIRDKRALAHAAKQSYAHVAAQSNCKLAEIEQQKARHHVAYFQSRYLAIFEDADTQWHSTGGSSHVSPVAGDKKSGESLSDGPVKLLPRI